MKDTVFSVNGPVVTVPGSDSFSMLERVEVGKARLVGEIITVTDSRTTIQVYESTAGMKVGEPVIGTGAPLSAELGPGLLSNIFDGILRPLPELEKLSGSFISNGIEAASLSRERRWDVVLKVSDGDFVTGGQVFACCPETPVIEHRSMIPPNLSGTVCEVVPNASYTVDDVLAVLVDAEGLRHELTLKQYWPIRRSRPVAKRNNISVPLITGQRVVDSLFPIAKGGTAAIPGGFGTGKTMTQHQLAKWCDADIIVYIGCGERGNEMTQVLEEFSELIDPKNNRPMTDRTILIANTSNMPVAAREASIYTGVTLAEYYRDMGYDVAMMADSTSRWAEALREISGRLEEMPAEEGYPAYLPSRLAEFYERAGCCTTLGGDSGSITIIGAVSPQGNDFSEPVTQNTKRFVRCFLALDKALAYARHYPAINWNDSYSEYYVDLNDYYSTEIGEDFTELRTRMVALLGEESKLMEIVKLVGSDVLPDSQKVTLEVSAAIRTGFLQQNAYHKDDTYVPLVKQRKMMQVIIHLYDCACDLVEQDIPFSELKDSGIFDRINRIKYDVPNDNINLLDSYIEDIDQIIVSLKTKVR